MKIGLTNGEMVYVAGHGCELLWNWSNSVRDKGGHFMQFPWKKPPTNLTETSRSLSIAATFQILYINLLHLYTF